MIASTTVNLETDPYTQELEAEHQKTRFIKVNLDIDEKEAMKQYEYDYNNNVDGCADCYLSYSQWLSDKEYQAIQFYIKIHYE